MNGDDQEQGAGVTVRRSGWLASLAAFAVYAVVAVAAYLPTLPLSNTRTQICTCGDTAQEVWFLGWVPFALTHGHALFYSNWILYPAGVNLMDNTAMPLLGVIAAPVTMLAGPVAAYNLVMRLAFALSALAMFLLVKRLVNWWPAAFAAGLLYGFSPFMAGQGLSHEFLVFAPIPPLVFLILLDVFSEGRLPARRAGLLLGLLFAAQFLIASETFVVMALMAVIGCAVALRYQQARQHLRRLGHVAAWAAGACAVVVAYPVSVFLTGPRHVTGSPHPLGILYSWHGDLLGALLPSPLMRFAPASLLRTDAALVAHNLQENGTYLGLPLVLLAACLAIAYRRRPVTAISAVLALVSYALSLGTKISIANHTTPLPGPFIVLAHLPVLADIEPVRFSLFTALFVAVVLGTGLAHWRESVIVGEPRDGLATIGAAARGRPVLIALVGLAALVPLVPRWPYPVGATVTPPFFSSASASRIPPGTVVATYPYPNHGGLNQALVWQAETSMRFRLVGGPAFFVPGPGGRGVNSDGLRLRPYGIDQAFQAALSQRSTAGDPPAVLTPGLVTAIRTDLSHYHVGTVIVDPAAGHDPGLAVRYITAATGHHPQWLGGVYVWFGLPDK